MKAFVTGSTGLLGSNLVRLLLAQGHEVKALARSREKAERFLGDTEAEIVIGDMQDVAGFADEMAGSDVLFHAAAYFREYYNPGEHWDILKKINVDGVREILETAERQGVKKAIHVSSSGVIGRKNRVGGDETTPPPPLASGNLYFKSKVLAEEVVNEFVKRHEMPVVMILPGWMMGPNDTAPTQSGQLVLDVLHGELPGVFAGGNSIVDARDVAQAMINAVEDGRNGERYIVGGSYHTLSDLVDTVGSVSGVKVNRRVLPYPMIYFAAWVSETVARIRNTDTLMTRAGVETLRKGALLNSEKAKRELGIVFRPLPEIIADEILWFNEKGYINQSVTLSRKKLAASGSIHPQPA